MTKNPLINAFSASAYIVFIATFMFYASKMFPRIDSFLAPVAMISLFTLSAAVMGYLFLSQPFQLYLDNKKKQAVGLFVHTVGYFAGITVLVFVLLLSGIIK